MDDMEEAPADGKEWEEVVESKDTVAIEEEDEDEDSMEMAVGNSENKNLTQSDMMVRTAPYCGTTARSRQLHIHRWEK